MSLCYDCPRDCGVDRKMNKGYCKEGDKIRVAKVIENFMWEEPCISGNKGALAIFFSGCNLRCEFCQNYEISHKGKGELYLPEEFKNFLLSFDLEKFDSIDLITPTHFSSLLIESLKDVSFPIPVVWNSGGYEKEEMIERLSEIVDVFLPDLKFYAPSLSGQFSKAADYFEQAKKAILAMKRCKSEYKFENGVMKEGVLIRHLVLPGHIKDSFKLLEFIKQEIPDSYISIMGQFTPLGGSIKDRLKPLEYKLVLAKARGLGLEKGYFQDLDSASENFIPKF